MRDIIPFIFWPWFATSCFVLLRRRVSRGSWKSMNEKEALEPIEFPPPPPPPSPTPDGSLQADASPAERIPSGIEGGDLGAVAVRTPVESDQTRSRSLAEAVEGIAMPCELAPLMGSGPLDPREVTFFTTGHAPATIGSALSDELERLGYEITPLDDRSIKAERGPDLVQARMVSSELTSEDVMRDLHPSAPAGALVVEMKLS